MSILQKSRQTLRRRLASLAVGVGVGVGFSAQADAEALTNVDDEELASLLESDEVADVMESASVLTRTRLLGAWVTSPSPRVRLLAAHALQRPFVVLGARSAIELLRNDVDPEVQTAANIAAVVRRMPPGV
jgi:hypothetical protein